MRFLKTLLALTLITLSLTGSAVPLSKVSGVAYFRQAITTHTSTGQFNGATESWRSKILLLHRAKQAGEGGMVCTRLAPTKRECYGSYTLPLGRIEVLGEIENLNTYQLSIVGGSGSYTAAQGVASFTPGLVTFYIS